MFSLTKILCVQFTDLHVDLEKEKSRVGEGGWGKEGRKSLGTDKSGSESGMGALDGSHQLHVKSLDFSSFPRACIHVRVCVCGLCREDWVSGWRGVGWGIRSWPV